MVEQAPKAAITNSIMTMARVLTGEEPAATASSGATSSIGRLLNFLPSKTGKSGEK